MYIVPNIKFMKKIMLNEGLTLIQLSKKSNVSYSTIRSIFNEGHSPRPDTAYKIAKALDVKADEIFLFKEVS